MSTENRSEEVPLAVWQLAAEGVTVDRTPVRQELARCVVNDYSRPCDLVVDLAPAGGEIALASVEADRAVVVVVTTPGLGGAWPDAGLEGLAGDVDLVVALPPEAALRHRRPFAPPKQTVAVTARQSAELLRPGGLLVMGFVGAQAGQDPLGHAVEVAGLSGLDYVQHVVALVTAVTDLAPSEQQGGRTISHTDLLVFSAGRA
jgi:hypothetical protein